MNSVLQVSPGYQTAGFGLAALDETESSGNTNDSLFATVLTVSPVDVRHLININFVDNIPKGAFVFTRNLTKTCVGEDVYNDETPNWPEQRSMAWDRPEYLKQFKVEFSKADYLEAGTIDQINYHFFELSKVRKFTPEDIHRLFNRWRLAGIAFTNDVTTTDHDGGSERMIQLQVAGRVVIPNYFEGPATPTKQRHLFIALKFIKLNDAADTAEYRLMNNDLMNVTSTNTFPTHPDDLKASKALFKDDAEFHTRLIPQLFYATSFHENVPKSERFDGDYETLFYRIGHVLVNNSLSQATQSEAEGNVRTFVNSGPATYRRESDIHINLDLF